MTLCGSGLCQCLKLNVAWTWRRVVGAIIRFVLGACKVKRQKRVPYSNTRMCAVTTFKSYRIYSTLSVPGPSRMPALLSTVYNSRLRTLLTQFHTSTLVYEPGETRGGDKRISQCARVIECAHRRPLTSYGMGRTYDESYGPGRENASGGRPWSCMTGAQSRRSRTQPSCHGPSRLAVEPSAVAAGQGAGRVTTQGIHTTAHTHVHVTPHGAHLR